MKPDIDKEITRLLKSENLSYDSERFSNSIIKKIEIKQSSKSSYVPLINLKGWLSIVASMIIGIMLLKSFYSGEANSSISKSYWPDFQINYIDFSPIWTTTLSAFLIMVLISFLFINPNKITVE
ncbi:MAG TPA: hypothetical protein PK147_06920 [Saprospiraceae bacterium]|nr:hypothetical protein [Saprospiraceae bacterium]HPK09819.1 hypothetical protein [Saprospiraceae bacterium]HPQ21566.1 hypothetical protein [Saprospiraceae bacterium]HRX29951.1 hypothetical protein [Saprospiraceae bacterium]